MTLNLMGIPTDLPLYDQQGNLMELPDSNQSLMELASDQPEFAQRDSTEQEKHEANVLLGIVREELSKVDDIGADLTVSDLVNVYNYDVEEGQREYYTVTIFGGKNGAGVWSNYLRTVADLVLRLEAVFDDVWIRKWDIDTADDVFDIEIAVLTYLTQFG